MKTPAGIYAAYRIMPNLQLHQLRVAAVVETICDDISALVDREPLMLAALFHDMGNIVKFDLMRYPEFLEPEGAEYWRSVQEEYRSKYGESAHKASVMIGEEIGLPEKSLAIIDRISFSHLDETARGGSLELKICEYGDSRVGPHGVLPLRERYADAQERYLHRYKDAEDAREKYEWYMSVARTIERDIFSLCPHRTPESITDELIAPRLKPLRNFPVR